MDIWMVYDSNIYALVFEKITGKQNLEDNAKLMSSPKNINLLF